MRTFVYVHVCTNIAQAITLVIIWPQTEDVTERTFVEAVKDLPFQYDFENAEIEQKTFTAISNIHSHYTNRAEGDDAKAVKLLMDKLNDPERINWNARLQTILTKLKITSPVDNIREFRFVLLNMFAAVREDTKKLQSELRLKVSGNSRTRTSEPTTKEKLPTGAPAKHSTVCGQYFHDSSTCRHRDSLYANHANKPFIGSDAHAKLVKARGGRSAFIALEGASTNQNLFGRERQNQPLLNRQPLKKGWKNRKGEQVYSLFSSSTSTSSNFLYVSCHFIHCHCPCRRKALVWRAMHSWTLTAYRGLCLGAISR